MYTCREFLFFFSSHKLKIIILSLSMGVLLTKKDSLCVYKLVVEEEGHFDHLTKFRDINDSLYSSDNDLIEVHGEKSIVQGCIVLKFIVLGHFATRKKLKGLLFNQLELTFSFFK